MRRAKLQSRTVVFHVAVAIAAFGLAAFVAYGMSTNAHQEWDGYYAAPSLIAVQLIVGAIAVTACLITCVSAVGRAVGRSSSIGWAIMSPAISVALSLMWFMALAVQGSS